MDKIKNNRILAIDGIRGLSAVLIVLYHYTDKSLFIPFVSNWGGGFGNDMFFALSGFCLSLVNTYKGKEGVSLADISLHTFLFERIKKIIPSYSLSILFLLVFEGVRNISEILLNCVFMGFSWFGNDIILNRPTWFISILVMCYILYYLINRLCTSDNKISVYAGMIIVGYALTKMTGSYPIFNKGFGYGMVPFFAGCLRFYVYDSIKGRKQTWLLFSLTLLIIGLCSIGTVLFGPAKAMGDDFIVFSILIIPLTLLSVVLIKPLNVLFSNPFFVLLGKISMYLFIWHYPVSAILKKINLSWINSGYSGLIFRVLLAISLSYVYMIIEKKAVKLIKHE